MGRGPVAMALPLDVDPTAAALVATGATALGFGVLRTFVYFRMQVGALALWFGRLNRCDHSPDIMPISIRN